ncbi:MULTISPECIES: nickel insertion protein [Paenibacillus]|uniref:Nickel insertion protein n=1 Tax=Paenibacillus residui TaxID=629724 RepID=A0ABW3D6R1_9BACL
MKKFDHGQEHRDDGMVLIQTNLDDMNPEYCPYITDRLLEKGANDVYWIPILMKKGRPGLMLNVLTDGLLLSEIETVIFEETTTLGLRYMPVSCSRLGRNFEKVSTPWGAITVKTGYKAGKLVHFAPEHEDCAKAAREHGIPIKQVYEYVRAIYISQKSL